VGYARAGSNPAFGTTKIERNNKGLAIVGRPFLFEIPTNSAFAGTPNPNPTPEIDHHVGSFFLVQ
jgi:hypothetical protein